MSGSNTIRRSADQLRLGTSDWRRVDQQSDEDIARAISADADAAPVLDEDWFRSAELALPSPKIATSIRVDSDVMNWFRSQGRGWQTRMNAVLRAYAKAQGGVK
ncbi:BrnA antitoxin family protein [Phenylobacterium sp.]|uniref:BrnA antitoxin family protein n=1 Tax=Phenylobacterium sp. TaxID=1871053 RepID=UPI00391A1831